MLGIGLIVAALALRALGPSAYEQVGSAMTDALGTLETAITGESVGDILLDWLLLVARIVVPFAGILIVVGVTVGLLQTQFLFTTRTLVPNLQALNPIKGLQRIFSLRTLTEVIKGLLKLALVAYIAYRDFIATLPAFPSLMEGGVAAGTSFVAERAVSALQSIGIGLLAIGILDYGYQYWEFRRSLRMTKQEVKQEFREQEGSPELRQRQRARARELALHRRALKDVPLADVVVTNPTHYAVAIKYDAAESPAPKVLAKGADLLAQRIRQIAQENDVPTVENRPLARALYDNVAIGQQIPPELYQAVAEVLAFVYSLRRHRREP